MKKLKGFAKVEKRILNETMKMWNDFHKLDVYHLDDRRLVRDALRTIQHVVSMRVITRNFPKEFHKEKNND